MPTDLDSSRSDLTLSETLPPAISSLISSRHLAVEFGLKLDDVDSPLDLSVTISCSESVMDNLWPWLKVLGTKAEWSKLEL